MNNITNTTGLTPPTPSVSNVADMLDMVLYNVNEMINDLLNHFIPETTQIIQQLMKSQPTDLVIDDDLIKKLSNLSRDIYPEDGIYDNFLKAIDDLTELKEEQESEQNNE